MCTSGRFSGRVLSADVQVRKGDLHVKAHVLVEAEINGRTHKSHFPVEFVIEKVTGAIVGNDMPHDVVQDLATLALRSRMNEAATRWYIATYRANRKVRWGVMSPKAIQDALSQVEIVSGGVECCGACGR